VTDPIEKLEKELGAMRPREISQTLGKRIKAAIAAEESAPGLVLGDRLLIASMGCGALAACVIAGILLAPRLPSSGSIPTAIATVAPPPSAEYPMAWVHVESEWQRILK